MIVSQLNPSTCLRLWHTLFNMQSFENTITAYDYIKTYNIPSDSHCSELSDSTTIMNYGGVEAEILRKHCWRTRTLVTQSRRSVPTVEDVPPQRVPCWNKWKQLHRIFTPPPIQVVVSLLGSPKQCHSNVWITFFKMCCVCVTVACASTLQAKTRWVDQLSI